MKKIFIYIYFVANLLQAQTPTKALNIQTPNVANLGIYGSVPISKFTGIPNVDIPLYDLVEGDIKVPISLSYHLGSIKPDIHPSWVGLGWSLFAGGSITRTVNKLPDDYVGYYSNFYSGYFYKYGIVNKDTWSTEEGIKNILNESVQIAYTRPASDVAADEFNFNFLGFSGSFYLNHLGKWVVKSDQNLKVVFDSTVGEGFITPNNLRYPYSSLQNYTPVYAQSKLFNKFTIIDENGTKYTFGGKDATEYSCDYYQQKNGMIIPTTWHLTKIESKRGHVVNFKYQSTDFTCTLSHGYSYRNLNMPGSPLLNFNLSQGCLSSSFTRSTLPVSGFLLQPLYLSNITSQTSNVQFDISNSTELRYTRTQFEYNNGLCEDENIDNCSVFVFPYDSPNQFKWNKLDNINIKDSNSNIIKRFKLNYNNLQTERLKLLSIDEKSNDTFSAIDKTHSFDYNPNKMCNYMQDKVDHWGYFNDTSDMIINYLLSLSNLSFANYYLNVRQPNATGGSYKAETLEKITYPTGGYTEFEYEQHQYRKVVNLNRDGFITDNTNKKAGGLRIKKIKTYPNSDSTPITKEYLYVKGYTGQSDTSSLESSGILNSQPQYLWENFSNGSQIGYYIVDLFSSHSLIPETFNSNGSPVGYSEVVELTSNLGYTIETFTNYDVDIWGQTHMDEKGFTIDVSRSVYSPVSSKSLERGKISSIKKYNTNNTLLKYETFKYQKSDYDTSSDVDDFVRIVDIVSESPCSFGSNFFAFYGTSYKKYIYDYNLVEKKTTVYNTSGNSPITTTQNYNYTTSNAIANLNRISVIIDESQITTKNKALKTSYKYPFDYVADINDSAILSSTDAQNMVNENLLSYKIKTETTLDNIGLKSEVVKFKDWDTTAKYLFLPETILKSKGSLTNTINVEVTFNNYDDKGNLLQYSPDGGVPISVIWGYNKTQIVAKLENISYASIPSNLTTAIQTATDTGTEGQVLTALTALRNSTSIPNAMITTYTYDPLIGLTSITDPKGDTQYYEYDDFNRLKWVKDKDGNILSENQYHYKN